MSTIESIIKGGTVDLYRYHKGYQPSTVAQKVLSLKERMKRKKPVEYFKGLVPSLVQTGFLQQDTVTSTQQFRVSLQTCFMCIQARS
jgi:hypothetical protein